ncbi:MAG: alpha/beta fold hydrolase [Planctomycetaceae bacterium]
MERVRVDGLRLAFERRGQGPPLLLLHGGASDHREWQPQLSVFAARYTTVAWDAPGCGGSSDPPATFRFPDYADTLAAFIEAIGLERPHVLGLSWGSTLALELVRRHPSHVHTLVLTAAYAGWKGSLPSEEVERRLASTLHDLEGSPEAYARRFVPSLFTPRAPAALVEETVAIVAELRPAGAEPMVRAMAEADLRDMLASIRVPVLLLYGEEDARSPRDVARELAEAIPGAALRFLPGAGHQANLETPDAFNEAVLAFLDGT